MRVAIYSQGPAFLKDDMRMLATREEEQREREGGRERERESGN